VLTDTFKYCSPTRSSLLTGRLPLHVNQNNECNTETSRSGIDLRMTLLPAKMKLAGYKTAMTGKVRERLTRSNWSCSSVPLVSSPMC
jgi:arylsulfatase A-like enzyme